MQKKRRKVTCVTLHLYHKILYSEQKCCAVHIIKSDLVVFKKMYSKTSNTHYRTHDKTTNTHTHILINSSVLSISYLRTWKK